MLYKWYNKTKTEEGGKLPSLGKVDLTDVDNIENSLKEEPGFRLLEEEKKRTGHMALKR